jgi:hypothetical protein
VRLAAFAKNKEGAPDSLEMREWPKGQARREYGFRACAKWRIYDVQLHIGE